MRYGVGMFGGLIRLFVIILVAWIVFDLFRKFRRGFRALKNAKIKMDVGDPYKNLNVSKRASLHEIKQAYKKALSEYHPDKVANLGDEIKRVSKMQTDLIIQSYQQILKEKS